MIDIWDIETFGKDLLAELHANGKLVSNYIEEEREIFLERDASRLRGLSRTNPHATSYLRFLEELNWRMKTCTIRAWHYTRLSDPEVEALRMSGIQLSTLEATRRRLDAQVAAGVIPAEIASALFEASPLHNAEQLKSRSSRFWMTSHPVDVEDDGVTLLLNNWGGEVVYFWLQDQYLQQIVSQIGKARVIEVAVQLCMTPHSYRVGEAVAATFAQSMGCIPDYCGTIDLYTVRPLGPKTVLKVHTEGEAPFDGIGKEYPATFAAQSRKS